MKISETSLWQLVAGLALLAVVGYNLYYVVNLSRKLIASEAELASSVANLTSVQSELSAEQSRNNDLENSLNAERDRNDALANQVGDIADTVGVLEKIKNTDPELLKKYSKVSFLNENYIPAKLGSIDKQYLFDVKKPQLFEGDIVDHLEDMLNAAKRAGIDLRISSAFRSFDTQADLKTGYSVIYGTGANQFSADQGYSEHQLGTAVDLILPTLTSLNVAFEKTDAYKWLTDNAYRYGFILSYPKGNAYYQFEPWHWRFVGVKLAKYLHNQKKNFYDLDQREIDTYRANFFD